MGSKLRLILLPTTWMASGWTGQAGRGTATAQATNDARRQPAIRQPATVVIDDSAFYEQMPKG